MLNRLMKKLILLSSAFIVLAASCSKRDSYRADAQVIGYDGTMCGCCSGFMIKLTDDNSNTYLLARTLPANAGINPMSAFPIPVEIDYDKSDKNCEKVITVSRITRK